MDAETIHTILATLELIRSRHANIADNGEPEDYEAASGAVFGVSECIETIRALKELKELASAPSSALSSAAIRRDGETHPFCESTIAAARAHLEKALDLLLECDADVSMRALVRRCYATADRISLAISELDRAEALAAQLEEMGAR